MDNGETKRVQVWDTGGQEQFRAISKPYYRNADCVLLIFDILDSRTLHDLESYLIDARELCPLGAVFGLIGTKGDLRVDGLQCVSSVQGKAFARRFGIPVYFETSAATGWNVEEAFLVLCQHVVNNRRTEQLLRVLSNTGEVCEAPRLSWRHSSASSRRSVERSTVGSSNKGYPLKLPNNFQPKQNCKKEKSCCS